MKQNNSDLAMLYGKKSKSFLEAAQALYLKDSARVMQEVVFYLLSHSLELAIKAAVFSKSDTMVIRGHRLLPLTQKYRELLELLDLDIALAYDLGNLNKGSGGLRYPNRYEGDFYPHLYDDAVDVIARLT